MHSTPSPKPIKKNGPLPKPIKNNGNSFEQRIPPIVPHHQNIIKTMAIPLDPPPTGIAPHCQNLTKRKEILSEKFVRKETCFWGGNSH